MPQFMELDDTVKIWLDFGTGDKRKTYLVNKAYSDLGDAVCRALPFFHALSGCDSTASFFEKPKKRFFEHWTMYYSRATEITGAFQQLSWLPTIEAVDFNLPVIEKFVASLYLHSEKPITVNQLRFELFEGSHCDNFRKLPPSKDALKQHVLRSSFQAGWVWGNTLSQQPPPSRLEWGWRKYLNEERFLIKWTDSTIEHKTSITTVTATCRCKSKEAKCTKCTCGKLKIKFKIKFKKLSLKIRFKN